MRQSQAGFLPTHLTGLSAILPRFSWHRLGHFHHRQHAAVHFDNQHGRARTIRPIAFLLLLRQHRGSLFLGNPTDGAHRNRNPIMFFQLARGSGKGLIGTKIGHGSLQTFRIPAALHFRGFGKGSNLRPAPTGGEELFFYFDFSQSRVPVEGFFSLRFTPGLVLYSSSFFCC